MPVKVEMTLTEQDVKNTQWLMEAWHKPSKVETVKAAVKLAKDLSKVLEDNGEVIVRHKNGERRHLVIPAINGG